MIIQIQQQDLDPFYERAKDDYLTCISSPENAHLQAEFAVHLTDIVVRPGDIKIVLAHANVQTYQLEVCLWLYAGEKYIGEYTSTMSATGEVVEDSLAFY